MNLKTYSLFAIRTPTAKYIDEFYNFKQHRFAYEQGFVFNHIDALSGVYDSSINNYTSQYLTNYKQLGDFIDISPIGNVLRNITTPLIFDDLTYSTEPKVLKINRRQDNTTFLSLLSVVNFKNNDSFFELSFFNNKYVRVLHNTKRGSYILNASSVNDVNFSTSYTPITATAFFSITGDNIQENTDVFKYQLDTSGYLQLYKYIDNTLYAVQLSGSSLTLSPVVSSKTSKVSSLIKIYYNFEDIKPKMRSGWVGYYNNKINKLSINPSRSDLNKTNQYLLHTNYNEVSDEFNLNYLALDNNRSEQGYIKRGTNTTTGSYNVPDTTFREYTTLRTGNDQEYGDSHIALTYVLYDKDIQVFSGTDTYFTTPSSIYPYEKLNVNDAKFTHNGSMAASTPLLSDKIFCLRTTNTGYRDGRYLCTWLSSNSVENKGIWVDRYYYPERISKTSALSTISVYEPSFNEIDTINYSSKQVDNIIFDKKSDLTIEPNTRYYYSRIGVEDVERVITSINPIVSGYDGYYNTLNALIPYKSNSIVYDGSRYSKFNIKDSINCTTQFTISFDFYVNPAEAIGYSLANSHRDFSILNDIKITPFITLYQGKTVFIYNTDFQLIKTVDFDTDVKEIIVNKPLDDFFIVCKDGILYRVNSLGNKLKRETIPLVSYINTAQDDDNIYFLLNIKGDVLRVAKSTFEQESMQATRLDLYPVGDIKSILIHNDILYGTPGENVKFKNRDEIYFLANNNELRYYNFLTNLSNTLFKSPSSSALNDFEITPNNDIVLIKDKEWYRYTSNRVFVLSGTTLKTNISSCNNIHVDTIREYTRYGLLSESTVILTLSSNNDSIKSGDLYAINIDTDETFNLGISGLYISDTAQTRQKYTFTNFNRLKIQDDNDLTFNITLTNYLSSEDRLTKSIIVNLADIDTGYHTFTYRVDTVQGNISLYIDGSLYQNQTISPYKYSIQQLMSEGLYMGAVGIANGIDLASYIKQPGYYFVSSSQGIRNLIISDRALKTDEIFALNLRDHPIDDLVLSIPQGQRNNVEEIERYFHYSPTTSSKSINIYVKNSGITNDEYRSNIKSSILEQAADTLPVGVKINDIKFLDFNQ